MDIAKFPTSSFLFSFFLFLVTCQELHFVKDAMFLLHLQSHACVFPTHLDGLDGNLCTEVGTKLCGSAGPELYSDE